MMHQKHTPMPLNMDATQRADLTRQAMAALFKAGGTETHSGASGIKMRLGLAYAVQHGAAGVLAVYRVRPDNLALQVMKRWPESIEKVTSAGDVGNGSSGNVTPA